MRAIKKNVRSSKILDVPDEVFVEFIFPYISDKSFFLLLELVCSKFFRILRMNILFKKICQKLWSGCFVENLPSSIMKKYYDDSFRKMFYLDNKYRFRHYAITKSTRLNGYDEIIEFDKINGSDIENQCLQSICLTEKYKNDFYSKKRFFIENENLQLDLKIACDPANEGEYYGLIDGPHVMILCAIKDEKKEIDERFSKLYYVMYMPGGNIYGYAFVEKSKKPFLLNLDNMIHYFDYPKRSMIRVNTREEVRKLRNPVFECVKYLLEHYNEMENSFEDQPEVCVTVDYLSRYWVDKLVRTNAPVLKIRSNTVEKQNLIICHIIDSSGIWSDKGTMRGIRRNFGDYVKLRYEEIVKNEPGLSGRNQIDYIESKKIFICSMICVFVNNVKERFFDDDGFRNCIYGLIEFVNSNKEKRIHEIHFDFPKRGSIKNLEEDLVIKMLNKLRIDAGVKVYCHDRDVKED